MQAGFVRLRSEEHAAQRSEKARKNSFLNYFLAQVIRLLPATVPNYGV
jgi:hypothetical protein